MSLPRFVSGTLLSLACALPLVPLTAAESAQSAVDLKTAAFPGTSTTDAGVAFHFNMGTKRGNWNRAKWSRIAFDEPKDWTQFAGLRLQVSSPQLRDDAGVYIALQEEDGSWHYHGWACELTQASNQGDVRFVDFRPATWVSPYVYGMPKDFLDENQHLDVNKISGLAIGCINPLGVGKLDFTVEAIELLPAEPAAESVTITVSGKLLQVNETQMIPAGLFGHFPGGGSTEMRMGSHREIFKSYLNGNKEKAGELAEGKLLRDPGMAVLLDVMGGDRYQPSPRLTNAEWEQGAYKHGKAKGRQWQQYVKQFDKQIVVFEWWNEPYLNWSNRTRKNFSPKFFDISKATEGGEVHRSIDGSVAEHLRWTKNYEAPPWNWLKPEQWRGGKNDKGQFVRGAHPPADVKDGEQFTVPVKKKVKNPRLAKKKPRWLASRP